MERETSVRGRERMKCMAEKRGRFCRGVWYRIDLEIARIEKGE